jgi:predicted nucleic acid-binding protein
MPRRPVRVGLDSNFLIALISEWHVHHVRTLQSYQGWIAQGATPIIALHSMLECYSVLTRIPAPRRLSPTVTKQILEENFARDAVIAVVRPETLWHIIDSLAGLDLGDGQSYDALIAHSVAQAGATVLLTWNTKHFLSVAPAGLEIREP